MTITVTASEIQKNFGKYKSLARREPVEVTSNGERSVIVISAEDYDRLCALDARHVYRAGELPEEIVQGLEAELAKLKHVEATDYPQVEFE